MKIKLERLIMRNDIIFKRSVQFRDQNKNSWTVDFEVYKEESTRINRETLQKFKQSFSVSVCGAGGMGAGQCYDHIISRTEGQKKLLEFWNKYHLGGMSGGTIRQDEYLTASNMLTTTITLWSCLKHIMSITVNSLMIFLFRFLLRILILVTRL